MQNLRSRQQGFTLIEIAIVLVIIGLLLGGVLKGQEMIENAKVKNAVTDMNGISSAINAYQDRFHQLPGDDPNATTAKRGGQWPAAAPGNGNGNGLIAGATSAAVFNPAAGSEAAGFWQDLRYSGLLSGDATLNGTATALPRNAFGGLTGIGVASGNAALIMGMAGISICMSNVPGKSAAALDTQLDDGAPNRGSVMAVQGVPGANTAPGTAAPPTTLYDENQVYTVCRRIQ